MRVRFRAVRRGGFVLAFCVATSAATAVSQETKLDGSSRPVAGRSSGSEYSLTGDTSQDIVNPASASLARPRWEWLRALGWRFRLRRPSGEQEPRAGSGTPDRGRAISRPSDGQENILATVSAPKLESIEDSLVQSSPAEPSGRQRERRPLHPRIRRMRESQVRAVPASRGPPRANRRSPRRPRLPLGPPRRRIFWRGCWASRTHR